MEDGDIGVEMLSRTNNCRNNSKTALAPEDGMREGKFPASLI